MHRARLSTIDGISLQFTSWYQTKKLDTTTFLYLYINKGTTSVEEIFSTLAVSECRTHLKEAASDEESCSSRA